MDLGLHMLLGVFVRTARKCKASLTNGERASSLRRCVLQGTKQSLRIECKMQRRKYWGLSPEGPIVSTLSGTQTFRRLWPPRTLRASLAQPCCSGSFVPAAQPVTFVACIDEFISCASIKTLSQTTCSRSLNSVETAMLSLGTLSVEMKLGSIVPGLRPKIAIVASVTAWLPGSASRLGPVPHLKEREKANERGTFGRVLQLLCEVHSG